MFEITRFGSKLVFWGALLFLLGILQGGVVPAFANPRMGLSAHLAAVQSGMALMIFGAVWSLVVLGEREERWTFRAINASMYLVWFGITLGAVLGASRALPIAGKGFSASAAGEWTVLLVIYAGAALGIGSMLLIVRGLYRGVMRQHREKATHG